jgi:hypothetical protein
MLSSASPERLSNAARGLFDFHPFVFETEPLTDHGPPVSLAP